MTTAGVNREDAKSERWDEGENAEGFNGRRSGAVDENSRGRLLTAVRKRPLRRWNPSELGGVSRQFAVGRVARVMRFSLIGTHIRL